MLSVTYRLRGPIAFLFGNFDEIAIGLVSNGLREFVRQDTSLRGVCENFYPLRRELPMRGGEAEEGKGLQLRRGMIFATNGSAMAKEIGTVAVL